MALPYNKINSAPLPPALALIMQFGSEGRVKYRRARKKRKRKIKLGSGRPLKIVTPSPRRRRAIRAHPSRRPYYNNPLNHEAMIVSIFPGHPLTCITRFPRGDKITAPAARCRGSARCSRGWLLGVIRNAALHEPSPRCSMYQKSISTPSGWPRDDGVSSRCIRRDRVSPPTSRPPYLLPRTFVIFYLSFISICPRTHYASGLLFCQMVRSQRSHVTRVP